MKKTVFAIISVIVLTFCTICAFAETEDVLFSDDYGKMYIGNESFSLCDTSRIEGSDQEYEIEVSLSSEQSAIIDEINVWAEQNNNTAFAYVYYKNGASLSLPYINDSIVEKYDSLFETATEYTVDFEWPDDNIVTAEKSLLFGEKRIMDFDASEYPTYNVSTSDADSGLTVYTGLVIDIYGAFYYADYNENEVVDIYNFDYEFTPDAVLHRITDKTLVENMQQAQNEYYGNDMDFLTDDDFFETFSKVFLIILFCVIPAALLVISVVAAIRCRGIYRKLYFTVCIFCAAELSVFITLLILISRYN